MADRAHRTILFSILITLASGCVPALAQGYPDKTIAMVVPYAPGGATDLLARAVGQKMTESMGQNIMV
jgi:tripartite-type tricarboxylate transporter receptor subunit TctC